MTPLDWTQIGLFGAGVVVHFLYTRLAPATTAGSAASPGSPGSPAGQEVMQVLATAAKSFLAQQAAAPAQSTQTPTISSTEAGLLALLHKLVDQQGQPATSSAPAATPAATR